MIQTSIEVGTRRYYLCKDFTIEFVETDNGLIASHRSLPMIGIGSDREEALRSFYDSFDFQWRSLVDFDPNSLTNGGKLRRQAMCAVVDSILDL